MEVCFKRTLKLWPRTCGRRYLKPNIRPQGHKEGLTGDLRNFLINQYSTRPTRPHHL